MEITVETISTQGFVVYLSGLDNTYERGDRYVDWYLYPEATRRGRSTIGAYSTISESFSFSGLREGTSYQIFGLVYWTDGSTGKWNNKQTELLTITTSSASKIALWSWNSSNGVATSDQTKKAYTAITNNGYVRDFNYRVWNDLVSKLNEYIIKYQKSTWNGRILSLTSTKMTESDKTLTAKRFNSLRDEMNEWFGTDYSMVSPGDEVKGGYFTEIATKLNLEINFANSQL